MKNPNSDRGPSKKTHPAHVGVQLTEEERELLRKIAHKYKRSATGQATWYVLRGMEAEPDA